MRRNLSILTVVAAAQAVATAGLLAYVTHGVTWTSSSVPYYVNPANMDLPDDALIAGVQAGASTWHDQSTADFSFFYAGRTAGTTVANNAKNEVMFRNATNNGAVATTYRYSSDGRILDADIVFWDASYRFFTGTSGCSSGLYVEDVAAHEFGHALGLAHTTVGEATMYPSGSYCSQALRSLAADDVAGVEFLYPSGGAPPAAPTSLRVVAEATNPSSSLFLSWTDNATNEDEDLVERAAPDTSWMQVARVGANSTSFLDTGLAAATTYTYRVRASNRSGFSAYTNEAAATTSAASPPPVPSSPSPSNSTSGVNTKTNLGWSCSGATSYDVYLGAGSLPATPYASGLSTTSKSVSGLASGTTYYWKVVARNAAGASESSVWQFRTKTSRTRK